jgi:putative ubiquitin-RnfH superfamily antitoxin RatB of RatAB toxin-antitoxin module
VSDIDIEVAYATPEKQVILSLTVPEGTALIDAASASGITTEFDGFDLRASQMGVFGKVVPEDYVLRSGDRIEIYRPLIADPKEVRKERAAKAKESRGK